MGQHSIKVGIADDDVSVRAGLRRYFSASDEVKVVGEASDAEEAIALVKTGELGVLLLDVHMPGRSGIDVLPDLLRIAPRLRVIVMSGHSGQEIAIAARRAGACAYLAKSAGPVVALEAVKSAVA